jgi:hypothetical protein
MTSPADVAWPAVENAVLQAALEDGLRRHYGEVRTVRHLVRRPSRYRSSFLLEEVDALLDNGVKLELVFKDVSRAGLMEGARDAKPEFLYDPLREISVYENILGPAKVGTATCFAAVADAAADRYFLLLERVAGLELYQLTLDFWQEAARWLARFHTYFAQTARALPSAAPLLNYDAASFRFWFQRLKKFWERRPPSDKAVKLLARLAPRYEIVVDRLAAQPASFLHGEFYGSNVLVQTTGATHRVCPVDWEMAAVGPCLIDLAALSAGKWSEDQRRAIALAYHAELPANRVWSSDPAAFLIALDYCRLHVAVQWLAWSPGWSPPPHQAHDWLGEACLVADKLGL